MLAEEKNLAAGISASEDPDLSIVNEMESEPVDELKPDSMLNFHKGKPFGHHLIYYCIFFCHRSDLFWYSDVGPEEGNSIWGWRRRPCYVEEQYLRLP